METTTINSRTYTVEVQEVGPKTRENLISNGWDGKWYILTGKRGATHLAFRTPAGQFGPLSRI